MVADNLTMPHDFKCLTDQPQALPGVDCIHTPVTWPGWWQKVALFEVARGPFIYLDLDTLITGSLDKLADAAHSCKLGMPRQFKPGGRAWQSSVIVSNGSFTEPFDDFEAECLGRPNCNHFGHYGYHRFPGDQDYLSIRYEKQITTLDRHGILSYKYHCRNRLPRGASVVTFHGKPDYDEVRTPWVRRLLARYK
jgi:hypothetical protein